MIYSEVYRTLLEGCQNKQEMSLANLPNLHNSIDSSQGVLNSLNVTYSRMTEGQCDRIFEHDSKNTQLRETKCPSCGIWEEWACESQQSILQIQKRLIERQKVLQTKMKSLESEVDKLKAVREKQLKQFKQQKNKDQELIKSLYLKIQYLEGQLAIQSNGKIKKKLNFYCANEKTQTNHEEKKQGYSTFQKQYKTVKKQERKTLLLSNEAPQRQILQSPKVHRAKISRDEFQKQQDIYISNRSKNLQSIQSQTSQFIETSQNQTSRGFNFNTNSNDIQNLRCQKQIVFNKKNNQFQKQKFISNFQRKQRMDLKTKQIKSHQTKNLSVSNPNMLQVLQNMAISSQLQNNMVLQQQFLSSNPPQGLLKQNTSKHCNHNQKRILTETDPHPKNRPQSKMPSTQKTIQREQSGLHAHSQNHAHDYANGYGSCQADTHIDISKSNISNLNLNPGKSNLGCSTSQNTLKTIKLTNNPISVERSRLLPISSSFVQTSSNYQKGRNSQICCKFANDEKTTVISHTQDYAREGNPEKTCSNGQNLVSQKGLVDELRKLQFENQNLKSYNRVLLQKLSNSRPKKY